MLISHRSKFVFVHIQRTAGGTLTRILKPLSDHPKPGRSGQLASKLPVVRDPRKLSVGEHATALDVRKRWPRDVWDSYFKFAFVRNPYSRLVSLYTRLGSSTDHRHYKRVSAMTFAEYVEWEARRKGRRQHDFVCDGAGEVIVDFIGRLENFDADVATICGRLGVATPEVIPKLGGRKRDPWQTFYDDDIRARVASLWARDLELFGYDFEGPRADRASLSGST